MNCICPMPKTSLSRLPTKAVNRQLNAFPISKTSLTGAGIMLTWFLTNHFGDLPMLNSKPIN